MNTKTCNFQIGDAVTVSPLYGDVFHEFIGHIKEFQDNLILVVDQEDNVWFVGLDQIKIED